MSGSTASNVPSSTKDGRPVPGSRDGREEPGRPLTPVSRPSEITTKGRTQAGDILESHWLAAIDAATD